MKKGTALFLALLMTLGITACGGVRADDVIAGVETAVDIAETIDGVIGSADSSTAIFTSDEEELGVIGGAESEIILSSLDEDGWYYTKEEVSEYLYVYGELPSNFLTKDEARDLGWEGGSVERYLEGAAIGGDKFGNREGKLPRADGRQYYECDIDTNGADERGPERIVYSNDGLIYYTPDHYVTFTLLYGEE